MRLLRHLRPPAAVAALACALLLAGCGGMAETMNRPIVLTEATVVAMSVGEAEEVSADDLAEAMLRAGFTPEEILAHGAELHNALATAGGAQLRQGKLVSALFAVHAGKLYVTSRERGTFVHPLASVASEPVVVVAEPPPSPPDAIVVKP
jgi:hypothetical protein